MRQGNRKTGNCAFGNLLREWRRIRKVSQLDLAVETGVSQRYLSFVESGRAQPSRAMILKLSAGLDLPLRVRNALLQAAGYAVAYLQRPAAAADMKSVQEAIARMLDHHEPYPAIVTDGEWNVVMRNTAAARLLAACVGAERLAQLAPAGVLNFMRLMFAPNGLRPSIRNWDQAGSLLLNRLHAEALANPESASARLWREFQPGANPDALIACIDEHAAPVLPLELAVSGTHLRLFTMFTTISASQDIGLRDLRIDLSFPADEATREYLTRAAEGRDPKIPAGVRVKTK
jgi:transcriptional regulator with XRE-family HTH domain